MFPGLTLARGNVFLLAPTIFPEGVNFNVFSRRPSGVEYMLEYDWSQTETRR
jgi:hypothetical protein